MSTILITGATGFVGSMVVNRLLDFHSSFQKIILTRNSGIFPKTIDLTNPKIQIHDADLTKIWNIGVDVDVVINLAGDGSQHPYSRDSGEKFLLIGRRLIEYASKSKSSIFHASSGGVEVPKGDNSHRLSVFSYYRRRVEEEIIEAALKNSFNAQIGRLYSFVGPYFFQSKPKYMINQLILEARSGRDLFIKSSLESRRSLMHERDMADWILQLSKLDGVNIWNVAGDKSPSLKEIAEEIASFFSVKVRQTESVSSVEDYFPLNIENELNLGLKYKYTWREGLMETSQMAKGLQVE